MTNCPETPVCEVFTLGWSSVLFKIWIAQPPLQTESGIGVKSGNHGLPLPVPGVRKLLVHLSLFNINFIHHHAFSEELKVLCMQYMIHANIWTCGNRNSRCGGLTNVSMAIIHFPVSLVRFIRTLKFILFKIINYFAVAQTHIKSCFSKWLSTSFSGVLQKRRAEKEIGRKVRVVNQSFSWELILGGNELEYQGQMI